MRTDDQPIQRGRLEAMLRHMKHRGPDGEGLVIHASCGLAHARLSIIDLLSGAQPMQIFQQDSDGPLHLVFNGEIYNHRRLRKKLEKRGHVFRSDHSDTEVLLLGYRQWGERLPKHLHGMFSFAIWDERERQLFLCRDRVGKKPLYLRWSKDRKELMFASLIGTITAGLSSQESIKVNQSALLNYLQLGYSFSSSMIEGIEELPPGHFMRVEHDGEMQVRRYWRPPPISKTSTSLGVVDSLYEVLSEAVAGRLEADVSLGGFLSGGIDSSLVCAIAQQQLIQAGGEPLRTYSVSMPDVAYDESAHASRVAKHLGTHHTVLETRVSDTLDDLERLIAITGEPTADSSLLPTYWLCKAARPFCKVALSGDGGDELFGGYDRYRAMRLLERHGTWLRALPSAAFQEKVGHAKSKRTRLGRLVEASKAGSEPSRRYRSMIKLFSDHQIESLAPSLFEKANKKAGSGLPSWRDWDDVTHAAMRWDFEHYLPYELLRKVDRAAMAMSLEVRCPLLDTQVCDLAGHLPTSVLMPKAKPKFLLRQLAHRFLPEEIVQRRKQGFAVPIDRWFRHDLKDTLTAKLDPERLSQLGLDPFIVKQYRDEHLGGQADHGHRLFALLQLSLWSEWLDRSRGA